MNKKYFALIAILLCSLTINLRAHMEWVHQFITQEAYNLIQHSKAIGNQIKLIKRQMQILAQFFSRKVFQAKSIFYY